MLLFNCNKICNGIVEKSALISAKRSAKIVGDNRTRWYCWWHWLLCCDVCIFQANAHDQLCTPNKGRAWSCLKNCIVYSIGKLAEKSQTWCYKDVLKSMIYLGRALWLKAPPIPLQHHCLETNNCLSRLPCRLARTCIWAGTRHFDRHLLWLLSFNPLSKLKVANTRCSVLQQRNRNTSHRSILKSSLLKVCRSNT